MKYDYLRLFSVEKFSNSGLMKKEYDRVKLHVTLLNTLFRRDAGDLGDRNLTKVCIFFCAKQCHRFEATLFQERESFDAREILETWSELSLGRVSMSELHLSQRRAGRRTAAGYYLPSAVLKVNTCQ